MGARCQEIWRQSGSTCQDCPVKKSIADGTIESIVIRTPDGTAWQVRTCPVRDANGVVTRILEIRENITERLRPLDALRLSEEKFSKAFHWNSTLMTISSLEDGIYDEVNEASLRATGLTREAVIGRSSTAMGIISQADRKKLLAVLKHHGSVKNLPLTLMPQRPNPLQVLYSAEVITINGQKKLLSMAQDVTALVQTQQELDQERSLLIESKRMLQTILDGIPDVIGLQETDHTIIAYNQAGYDLLGLTPEAVRGKKCYELLGYRYSCDHCATTKALASGRIETIERYEPALDRWFKVNAIPIFGADGAISMIVEQLHEITAERKKEVQLRRLGSAIHQVAEAVLITDGSGTIEYVNPAFEAITGYSRAEAVGRTPRILKSGHHDEAFYGDLWDTITAGRTWHGRMVNRKKNGTVYHEEVSISPVFDQQGTIVNFVAVKRDITEQLDLEEHLRQAQKMEAIGALAGGIAHDFNNILFPLVGFAEMLQEDLPPESPLQDHVDEILRASTRARDLVQQILAFSRQAKQEKKAIRIQTIVKEVIKLCRASLPSTITIDAKMDNRCRSVVADPTQIHQVAMNLITNAFHAMEETGGALQVTVDEVECEPSDAQSGRLAAGTYVRLSVSDTGRGIDPAIRDKIFMPYFTTKDKNKGTGMGLAVVLGIVQSHGGDIQLKSTPGQGTEINAYFPCHAREAEDDAQDTTDPIPRGHERILLVDDEAPIVRMMRQKLERLGYGVTARTSSIEALEVFNAQPDRFDLVISDVTMPNMTGLQLALEIKRTRPRMPIILCTGYSEQFDRQRIKTLGIQGVVLKPVVTRELAKEIRAVLDADDPPGEPEASTRR
ncbi:PAS domain-containing hybrid sensor histidine kinase/response regulator [Desulfosarcina cetonica]|uniref:PAS domain-containing hybrid sensor histidine kinase/response regulator n=1 Tax=Desulfosarcina cetonica TaxID=90730 RepID=UPI0006D03010|nr:PAS domain-containing sensor histidine kinase [Desulfosarcina cetonica]